MIYPPWHEHSNWKLVVGRWIFFWDDIFSGLNCYCSFRECIYYTIRYITFLHVMTIDDSINLSLRCQEPWMSKSFFVRFFFRPRRRRWWPSRRDLKISKKSCDFGESLVGWEIPLGYTAKNEQLETKKAAWKKKHIYTCTSNFLQFHVSFRGFYKFLAPQSKTQRRVRS